MTYISTYTEIYEMLANEKLGRLPDIPGNFSRTKCTEQANVKFKEGEKCAREASGARNQPRGVMHFKYLNTQFITTPIRGKVDKGGRGRRYIHLPMTKFYDCITDERSFLGLDMQKRMSGMVFSVGWRRFEIGRRYITLTAS